MDLKPSGTASENKFLMTIESIGKERMCDINKPSVSIESEPVIGDELVSKRVQMFENLKRSSSNVSNEKKKSISPNVNIYSDLVASLIAVTVPNSNVKCVHRLKKACDSFDQSELEYLVKCLSTVPQDSRWTLVPSLVKNLKNQDYKDVVESYARPSMIVAGEFRNDLPANFKQLVEKSLSQFSGENVSADEDLNNIVAVVLLLVAVLRKNDEWATESVPNSSGAGDFLDNDIDEVKIQGDASENVKNDCDDDFDDNLSDFHVEKKPFSKTMTNFLKKNLKRRKVKNKFSKWTEIFSVDSALNRIISEIDLCTERSSEITDKMKTLSIADPVAVQDTVAKLKIKLENVKFKIDEYIANVLNGELKRQIDAACGGPLATINAGGDLAEPKIGSDSSETVPGVEPKDGINSVEMNISHRSSPDRVVAVSTMSKNNDIAAVEIKTNESDDETVLESVVSKEDDSSAVDAKISHGSEDIEIVVATSSAETDVDDSSSSGSEVSLYLVKKASDGRSVLTPESSESCPEKELVHFDEEMKGEAINSLRRTYALLNRMSFVPGDSLVRCVPCDTSFKAHRTMLKSHIKSSEHILNLRIFNTKLQQEILKSNREFLKTLCVSEQDLRSEKVFVDPDKKFVFCGICATELSFNGTSIYQHIRGKRHAANKPAAANEVSTIRTTLEKYIKINRIINVPYERSKLQCVPCGVKLIPDPVAVMSHVESDEHYCKLDEHNLILQLEIVKSNPDVFGEGKQFPLSEKHFREDRLFLNPVSGFVYCGVCRKEIILQDIQDDVLSHLSCESHVDGLTKFLRNNAQSNVIGSDVESNAGVTGGDLTMKQRSTEKTAEKANNNLWYISLTKWVANSDREIPIASAAGKTGEDGNPSSAKTLTEIVKMKEAGQKTLKFADFEHGTKQSNNLKSEFIMKKNSIEVGQTWKKNTKKTNDVFNDTKMAKFHRLVPSPANNRVACVSCGINMESDLKAVHKHVMSEDHMVNLCRYNCKAQKEIIKRNPHIFGQNKLFHMTNAHIERDMILIQPDGKFIFCGLCVKELTYSLKNVIAHVDVPSHVKKRMQFFKSQHEKRYVDDPAKDLKEDDELLTEETGSETNMSDEINKKYNFEKNKTKNDQLDTCLVKDVDGDSGLFVPCTTVVDNKIMCLLCDVRNIPNQKCLTIHLKSPTHQANVKSFNEPQNVTPNEQEILLKNMIALMYGRNPLVYKCFACQSSCFFDVKTAFRHIDTSKHIKTLTRVKKQDAERLKLDVSTDATTSKGKDNGGTVNIQEKTDKVQNTNDDGRDGVSVSKETHHENAKIKDKNVPDDRKQSPVIRVQNNGNPFGVHGKQNNELCIERVRTENQQVTPPRVMPVGNAYAVDNKNVKVVVFHHAKKFIKKTVRGYMCVECNLQILSIPMAYAHLRSCGHAPVIVDGVQFLKEANYQCLVCDLKIYGIKDVVDHISKQNHAANFAAK